MSAVGSFVAAQQRAVGDDVYARMIAGGASRSDASEAAAEAHDAERDHALLDFYGASHPDDV